MKEYEDTLGRIPTTQHEIETAREVWRKIGVLEGIKKTLQSTGILLTGLGAKAWDEFTDEFGLPDACECLVDSVALCQDKIDDLKEEGWEHVG